MKTDTTQGLYLTEHDLKNLRDNDFETWVALAIEDAKDIEDRSLLRTLRKIMKKVETDAGKAERKQLASMGNFELTTHLLTR